MILVPCLDKYLAVRQLWRGICGALPNFLRSKRVVVEHATPTLPLMTEGEQQDTQSADYKSLAAKEIWIKPAARGSLARVSAGFRWTPEERRLLWITAVGGAIGSLATLLVVGLAVAGDRIGTTQNKPAQIRDDNIAIVGAVIVVIAVLAGFAFWAQRHRQSLDRAFRQWQRALWSLIIALLLLALVGRAAGIH